MNLVIVESPTKAKTISRFLGRDFKVESSYGHVRDLPKSDLGIDIENNFEPRYVIPKKAQKNLNQLKKLSKTADKIILASDEDREGEAIAWHIAQTIIDKEKSKSPKIERIVFHEITKKAIEEALENPRDIDMNLVNAQQTRRILDRLVGYKLSPFLWKKLMRGLSAGRVQSVALRLIIEKEEEIKNFKPQDYWTIIALLQSIKKNQKTDVLAEWEAALVKIDEKPIAKPGILDKKEVDNIVNALKTSAWTIEDIEKKEKIYRPRPPFTTSTLQQASWQRYKFSAKRTMMLAQQLYEGIALGKEGHTGLITYMRTDSLNISEEALKSAKDYLDGAFGKKYSLPSPQRFKTKSKGAQEAHEAIRPSDPHRTPESIKNDVANDQYKIYKLIWERFLATQMPGAIFDDTIVTVEARAKNEKKYLFSARGSILKFDGFLKIYPMQIEEKILPEISKDDELSAKDIKTEGHQTQPPARYTDASLVKALEKFGIGRPSTYAQIISTLEDRNYMEKDQSKRFIPTEIGYKVNALLVEHFPKIVDINFTAKMEENLDEIASGNIAATPVLKEFYEPFEKNLKEKYDTVIKQDLTEKTDEVCELCKKPMVIKHGRFGKFIACSGFPECKNTRKLPAPSIGIKCPLCQEGDVIERKSKRGRIFFGCSIWPKCQMATWQKPTGELCPECNAPLVELKNLVKCSNKLCKYEEEYDMGGV
ncbi:MAG: type I DNA topoisomerase [bacterium]|nr:type I DNA topoisomerase [bacterium]